MSKNIDFTGKLLPNAGQNPKYMSSYPTGNAPTGTQHGARYVVNATGLQVASFGTKAAQAPAIWEQFTNGTEGQNLSAYDPSWLVYTSTGAKITALYPRYSGGKSAYNSYNTHPFATNYKQYTPSSTVFVSYWARIANWNLDKDGGVLKLSRITSSTTSGGGGVYNGVGGSSLGGGSPTTGSLNGYASFSGANDDTTSTSYSFPYPISGWTRVAHELKISDIGSSNGFFSTRMNNSAYQSIDNYSTRGVGTVWSAGTYNSGQKVYMIKPAGLNSGVAHTFRCTTNGTTSSPFAGDGTVNAGWSLQGRQDFLEDTFLLGLENANPWYWYKATALTANTTYTLTIDGVSCSYTSGGSAPTDSDVVNGILADATAKSKVVRVLSNTWIAGDGNATVTATNLTKDESKAPLMMNTDVYLDTSISRFEVGDSPVYSSCTVLETQPYYAWSVSQARFKIFTPSFSGSKYLFFIDNNRTVYALGAMQESGTHNA